MKLFVQDGGSGLTNQDDRDWLDAGHLAALAHDLMGDGYVVNTPTATVDYGSVPPTLTYTDPVQIRVPDTDVSSRARDSEPATTWPLGAFAAVYDPQTVSLTDSTMNHVYAVARPTGGTVDDGELVVVDDGAGELPPTDPSVLIHEVDTTGNSDTPRSRDPALAGRALTVSGDGTIGGALDVTGALTENGTGVTLDSRFPLPNSDLANSSVTVAGNAVGLGGSTGVAYTNLSDTGATFPIPNADLANDAVTIAGNIVALGGSTAVAHGDLSDAPAAAHHIRPIAGALLTEDASNNFNVDEGSISHQNIDQTSVAADDHHVRPVAGNGLAEGASNDFNVDLAVEGTVTLSGGAATVATGVTATPSFFTIYLDPSGAGANTADVKASARAYWDNTAGEYKVEILEDGTNVDTPDIGYKVVQY